MGQHEVNALPIPPPQDAAVTLARIEVKLDGVLSGVKDHEKRIRSLESGDDSASQARRAMASVWISAAAAAAAIGSLISVLIR